MALFGTMNVAGPANRSNTIQTLAQNAAQNVLRRQRLKSLLQQSASAAAGGPGVPIHSSLNGHALGTRGGTMRPDLTPDELAGMARSAGRAGHVPGGIAGGVYGNGGGGFDFGALPAPADHSQAPASEGASPFRVAPINPAPNAPVASAPAPAQGATPSAPAPTPPSGMDTMGFQPATYFGGIDAQLPSGVHGWIHLGNGLFYDPTNDIVRGASGNGLVGPDGKF